MQRKITYIMKCEFCGRMEHLSYNLHEYLFHNF